MIELKKCKNVQFLASAVVCWNVLQKSSLFLFESLLFQVSVSIVPKEQGNPEYPRHPEFALESERLSTFRTWRAQLTESLSRAGFYYTGEQLLIRERPE